MYTLPNYLTLARIACVPILLLLYPWGLHALTIFCGFLFALASVTDFFDGFLARALKSESKLGALLDPIADKLLSASALLVLAASGKLPVFLAGLILCRDIAMSGLRLIALQENKNIDVNMLGKVKTFLLSVALTFLLTHYPIFGLPLREIGLVLIWGTLILSYYSAYVYVKGYLLLSGSQTQEIDETD